MSRFRTAALGAVVVLGLAGVAGAQAQTRPDNAGRGMHDGMGRHGHMGARGDRKGRGDHDKFMSELKLTDAQKSQLKAIHAKYEPQVRALRDHEKAQFGNIRDMRQKGDTSAAARARIKQQREQFRQRLTALRQQEENEVRGVLTADQRVKWDAAQAQRKQRMEQMKRNRQNRGGQYRKGTNA